MQKLAGTAAWFAVFWALCLVPVSDAAGGPTLREDHPLVITEAMQMAYANTLFQKKDWATAQVEFKRFVHFFPESPHTAEARFKTGVCLFELKQFRPAARVFDRLIRAGTQHTGRQNHGSARDNRVSQAVFYQSRAFLALGNTGYAQLVLHNYLTLTPDPVLKDRAWFSLAKIQLSLAKKGQDGALDKALEYLSNLSEESALAVEAEAWRALVLKAKAVPKKDPALAGLAAVIPGGGFLYCNRHKDALTTFLLNAGLMVAAWQAWDHDNEALAGLIGFVEAGFYSGNIYGSISAAHKHNRAATLRILETPVTVRTGAAPDAKGAAMVFSFPF